MISRRVGFTVTLLTGITICVGTLTSSLTPLTSFGADKLHHGIAYAAFALPLVLVDRKYWRLMLTVTLILASTIELIQSLVNRSGDPMDLLTNATGGLIGLVLGTEREEGAGYKVALAVCLREVDYRFYLITLGKPWRLGFLRRDH